MYEYKCTASRVVDGDTVDLWVDLGFNITIRERFRLKGIDAPEPRGKDAAEKAKGIAATEFLRQLLAEHARIKIRTEKDADGRFGRWLGLLYVSEDGLAWHEVNTMMVANGHAVYSKSS